MFAWWLLLSGLTFTASPGAGVALISATLLVKLGKVLLWGSESRESSSADSSPDVPLYSSGW